ncbi:MAG TPA: hypothetical protein VJX92_12745 [Methylomirabilota bacterium]|nr:hypothetical protein [Methylomirabilota bacterium]
MAILFEPGAVVEVRVLETRRGTVSGYFNSLDAPVRSAAIWGGKAGIYVTLNVLNPELLARAANWAAEFVKRTTGDSEVVRCPWLLLDLDPARPSGTSATDGEHEAALQLDHQVHTWLAQQGWPEPVIIDSGNGAYLLYRIDLNDQGVTELVKKCGCFGPSLFSDEKVKIGTAVSKAAQLIRVPGTLNAKGDEVPTRPHRVARVLQAPESLHPRAEIGKRGWLRR